MSFWNKILAGLAASAFFAVPAFADGTPGQKINRGPEPVQAHQPVPPEPGCYLIENGNAWSCPARPKAKPHPTQTIHKQSAHKPCCGTFKQTIVKEHPPVVTKRTVTHRKVHQPTKTVRKVKVERSSEVQLDLASFTGGVGVGVDGGFYGGGGAVIITGGRSTSSVLTHSASTFTFRSRGGGKKRRRGGGCGKCMGGGMGGGD